MARTQPSAYISPRSSTYPSVPFCAGTMSTEAAHPGQQRPVGRPIVEVAPAAPRGASEFDKAVDATKKASIAIITIHIIALATYGWFFWSQILLTLYALIVSSVVMRRFEKCAYSAAAALYSLGFVADVWRVVEWFLFVNYLNDSTDEGADDGGVGWVILFALPCIFGAVLFLVGAACARRAVRRWEQSGIMLPID